MRSKATQQVYAGYDGGLGMQRWDLGGGREDVVAGEDVGDVGVETAVCLEHIERPLQSRLELSWATLCFGMVRA